MSAGDGRALSRTLPSRELTQVVRAAAGGDQAGWDALVDLYGGLVWAVARSHRLCAADAADVSQTTWLRLVENLGSVREPERIGAWLATTARRESLRILRMGKKRVLTCDDAVLNAVDESVAPVDLNVLNAERDRALWEAFERLPSRCQVMLRLLMGEFPLSYLDLARALEMPIGSIGPTRGRCLEHLRRLVEELDVLSTGGHPDESVGTCPDQPAPPDRRRTGSVVHLTTIAEATADARSTARAVVDSTS